MSTYCDNKEKYAYYGYDDAGQRTYKMTFNASYMANNHYGYPTLEVERMAFYPNGFMNINHYGEYTKHYYAENQRIASKIGTGSILGANLCNDLDSRYNVAPQDLSNLQSMVEGKAQKDLTFVTIPENMGTPQWVDMDYLDYNICNLQGDRYQNEDVLFFYHGNHLSSTQMITDMDGNIVQQVHYAPFGEIISEYNAYWHSDLIPNYTFNTKELDEESGMYYFEARYLKPPSFISRDPLFEKYFWLSPYHYCGNNPVKYIDPDGRWVPGLDEDGKVTYTAEKGDNKATFMSQYGVKSGVADKILGNQKIEGGKTVISGETVKNATGNEVLKMNWNSERATNQRKADQVMFAVKYSQQNSSSGVGNLKDFFTNMEGIKGMTNLSNVSINVGNGERIPVVNISLGVYDWTSFKTFGESPRDIQGTDDFLHDYRSSMNYNNIRNTMSIRMNNQYSDKYTNYYYNPASYYKK